MNSNRLVDFFLSLHIISCIYSYVYMLRRNFLVAFTVFVLNLIPRLHSSSHLCFFYHVTFTWYVACMSILMAKSFHAFTLYAFYIYSLALYSEPCLHNMLLVLFTCCYSLPNLHEMPLVSIDMSLILRCIYMV